VHTRRLDFILGRLHKLVGPPGTGTVSDGELLRRFAEAHDEAAFELLVRRYGPLVWGACRRLLGNDADAEDAFQATFLVLVRRAASLDRLGSLAGWLHGVAYRVSIRARANAARRHAVERKAGESLAPHAAPKPEESDLRAILDEELGRLPEKYRVPLLLCYFQGHTHEQAARQLAWPLGTVKCRLQRGRERLRQRLTRRGLAVPAVLLGAALAESAASAAPAGLVDLTIKTALHFAAAAPVAGLAPAAVSLAEGVLQTMRFAKLKWTAAVLLTLATLGGVGAVAHYAQTGQPATGKQQTREVGAANRSASNPALEVAWTDLLGDETKAARAVLTLAANAKEALPFLKERLKPVTVDPKRMAQWLADLDAETFAVREQATAELEFTGEYAVPFLRQALKDSKMSTEMTKRIEGLLERTASGRAPGEWVRAGRAIALLEHLGSADAKAILDGLAKGKTRTLPTQQAEAVLGRLAERPTATMQAIQTRWDSLASKDETVALVALLGLAATPKETVAFVKDRLGSRGKEPPAPAPGENGLNVNNLIADLGADDFAKREKAMAQLIELGSAAEPILRQAMQNNNDPEVKKRADLILKKIGTTPPAKPISVPAARRLAALLEHFDTPESRKLLEEVRQIKEATSGPLAGPIASPDGRTQLIPGKDGSISLIDAASQKIIWKNAPGRGSYAAAAFGPDGKLLAADTSAGMVAMIDVATGKLVLSFQGHNQGITAVSFSPDGKTVTSEDEGQKTRMWDVASGRALK
jgi:RNA polymerase sigma factor (sigma-70 family)